MDPKDLTEYALEYAQRLGASYAESRLISGERTGFFVQNGNILSGTRFNVGGIGIRVLVDGGLGFCSIDRIKKSLAEKAISAAVKMAKNSKRKVPIDFGEPIVNEAKWQVDVKKPIEDVSTEEMTLMVNELEEISKEAGLFDDVTRKQLAELRLKINKFSVINEIKKIKDQKLNEEEENED